MTDQEMRTAIAEACGVKVRGYGEEPLRIIEGGWLKNTIRNVKMPDYITNLNAMHEAEKVLFRDQWERFTVELEKTVGLDDRETEWAAIKFRLAHATARQRAEAFLKCLGKWKEKVAA